MSQANSLLKKAGSFLFDNKVMIAFSAICLAAILLSGSSLSFIVDGVFTRIGRNTFTVLALIIPVLAGLGLNFGIVIGVIVVVGLFIFGLDRGLFALLGLVMNTSA